MACSAVYDLYGAVRCCDGVPPPSSPSACAPGPIDVAGTEGLAWADVLAAARATDGGAPYAVGAHYALDAVTLNGTAYCPYAYASTLVHDPDVELPPCAAVQSLVAFLACPSAQTHAAIQRDASAVETLYGAPDASLALPGVARAQAAGLAFAPPASAAQARDVAEAYVAGYLRDCALDRVPATGRSCAEKLGAAHAFLADFGVTRAATTPATLLALDPARFRDAHALPSVSQLLYVTVAHGMRVITDRRVRYHGDDRTLWRRAPLLAVERGGAAGALDFPPDTRHVTTPRQLGSLVNNDPFHMHFTDAALACAARLSPRFDQRMTGDGSAAVLPSLVGGFDGLLAYVAEAGANALAESYRAKYRNGLKLRPQMHAHRIDLARRMGGTAPDALKALLAPFEATPVRRAFLERLREWKARQTGEYNDLLAAHYQSTRHPSWTHGHATVAGASVTVLKALLRVHADDGARLPWPDAMRVPHPDGGEYAPLGPEHANATTYVAELNKLAYNIGMGRNWATQHFRTELEVSLELGERVAMALLHGKLCTAALEMTPLRLELFNGTLATLVSCADGWALGAPVPLPPPPPPNPPPPPPQAVPSALRTPFTSTTRLIPSNFARMVPKPSATATHGAVAVDTVRLRQRQMAFGDSTMRRATVVLTRADGTEVRVPFRFGEPSLDGATGTRLTTMELDGYGRIGLPAFVEATVDPPVPDVVASTVIAEDTYPYKPPDGPIRIGGRVDSYGNPAFLTVTEGDRLDNADLYFYAPDGTFDVGLVDIELRHSGALVPVEAFAAANFSDARSGMNLYVEEHEYPDNAWLNPYRSAAAATYRKSSWPCSASFAGQGCAMGPVRRYWGFPGWALKRSVQRPYELLPLATPANFALLRPKPTLTLRFAMPMAVARVGLRQRQMAWGDATMARMDVYADGVLVGTAAFGAPSADGGSGTLLTDLAHDPYGRVGLAAEVNVSLPEGAVRELTFVAMEVHAYAPPAALADPQGEWDVPLLATQHPTFYDYVAPTQGTWNVGLTHAALYAEEATLVPEADVMAAEATASGAFAGPLFAPGNPFDNPYRTLDDQTFANGVGDARVYRSWCFDGWAVLHGETPTAYAFVEPGPPAPPPPPLLPGGLAPPSPDGGPVPEPTG
tara:strand:- start:5068 stop:8487 length:3420 start_codon:yes stop_codon:yes gene_type:complete